MTRFECQFLGEEDWCLACWKEFEVLSEVIVLLEQDLIVVGSSKVGHVERA